MRVPMVPASRAQHTLTQMVPLKAFQMVRELQKCSVLAECDTCGRSLKAQMKYADKIGADFTIVLGDDELASGKAVIKNMKTKEQRKIDLSESIADQFVAISTEAEDLAF